MRAQVVDEPTIARATLATQLEFERLLADLSATFVNVPAEDVDRQVSDAQRGLCEFFGVDRSTLWQTVPGHPNTLLLTHVYGSPGGRDVPEDMSLGAYFPWATPQVLAGRPVAISRMSELPPEAATDCQSWAYFGQTKSVLVLPLSAGGSPVIGILAFDALRTERDWPEPLVTRCRLIAEVIANALVRKRTERDLRESEERYRTIALNLPGMVFQFYARDDGKWGLHYVDPRAENVCGLSADPLDTFLDRFTARVAEEGREEWLKSIREAVAALREWDREFRFIKPSGEEVYLRGTSEPRRVGSEVVFCGVIRDITERKRVDLELERLKEQLQRDNVYLLQQRRTEAGAEAVVGDSQCVRAMLAHAQRVAKTDSTVLITGETGTGKELLAQAIHDASRRAHRPIVEVNCAALPPALIESELFGREKGAYTGAITQQVGRFEVADGSTLFLDEVAELPVDLQAKLLRVLQAGQFERLGSHRTLKVDVRVIAATNRDLAEMVHDGRFRSDLFYRLNVFPIRVPPLRERREDIPRLVWNFVTEFAQKMGKTIDSIPRPTMEQLQKMPWPGNIRELRNLIERAVILTDGHVLQSVPEAFEPARERASGTLEQLERHHIVDALNRASWRIGGASGAAALLGLRRTTLQSKMKKLGISRPSRG